MTGKVSDAGDSYLYTYNLQNRLQTATITRTETDPMGGPSKLVDITSAYVYNQSGIRVGASTSTKIDGGPAEVKNTTYLVDPANFTGYAQVLEQFDDGVLAKSYTLGDDVLAQTVGGTTSYLQYDGHGSTRLLTSATSSIANRFDYDAYGKNLFSANVTNPASTDMLYSGEQFDPNLQMQYLRARYYDQNNGTLNRLDPFGGNMGDPQSLHKYAYCHGNPVMGIDPSGKFTLMEILIVIGIIGILASLLSPALGQAKVAAQNQTTFRRAKQLAMIVMDGFWDKVDNYNRNPRERLLANYIKYEPKNIGGHKLCVLPMRKGNIASYKGLNLSIPLSPIGPENPNLPGGDNRILLTLG